jgi:hypothetical protein
MGVVIHGSFDEGPIPLALPTIFEGLLPEGIQTETDPLYSAWDKSTGISISKIQITDRSDLLSTDGGSGTTDIDTISIATTGTITASNLSGTNTGNQDLSGLVPYTGATGDVDLGVHKLSVASITIDDPPTNPTDAATRGYVDSIVTSGIAWEASVLDIVSSLPGGATNGDRYIHSTDNKINEWNGASWDETIPTTGMTVFVETDDDLPTNKIGNHTFNGTSWVYSGSSIDHNDTLNKEGGGGGHWYHLEAAQLASVVDVIDESNPNAPTGLTGTSDVELAADGHEVAYVSLIWDAIALSTLDHYHLIYKSSTQPTWTPIDCVETSITIHGLITGGYYTFEVAAVNKAGILSPYSTAFSLTVAVGTQAPSTVVGLVAYPAIQAVLIKWTDNIESNLSTYNIYRNTTNDSVGSTKIASWKGTSYMDNNLAVNTDYYYWIKALNFGGLESVDYSDVATAKTRMVLATDIYNIAANQVIIQGSTTFADLITPGTTTIDGDKITTRTIVLDSIDFSSTQTGGGIIAHINSTPENGLELDTRLFAINGSSIFTNKVGGNYVSSITYPAVRIFPSDNPDVGIQVVDEYDRDSFLIKIGGLNIGDVIIGNYNLGEGIRYNAALQTTAFKGTITAYAGSIGGWTIASAALTKDTGTESSSVGMSPTDYPFYSGASYAFRSSAPFRVMANGWTYISNLVLSSINPYTVVRSSYAGGGLLNSNITDDGTVRMTTATGGLVVPVVTSLPTPEIGKIIFYSGRFWGNTNGASNGWKTLD